MRLTAVVDRGARAGAVAGRSPSAGVRSESWLVRRAQAGDGDAIEELVRRHWDEAHRAAYLITRDRAAAEDVAQEACMAAVRSLGQFDRRRRFGAWLHRIVVNRSLDWLRAGSRRPPVHAHADPPEATAPDAPTDALGDEMMGALGGLEHETRALVVSRHLLGYSSRELGDIFGLPPATVRTKLARGLAALREALDEGEAA